MLSICMCYSKAKLVWIVIHKEEEIMWFTLKCSIEKMHTEKSIGITQASFGILLLVDSRLDIHHGHETNKPNKRSMLLVKRSLSISIKEDVS